MRYISLCMILPASLCIGAQTMSLDSCLALAHRHSAASSNAEIDVAVAQETKNQLFTKYFPQVQAMAMGFYSLNPMIDLGIDDIKNAGVRDILNMFYANYGAALGIDKSFTLLQHGTMAGVMAMQPVFVGGQIVNGNKLAQVGVEAARRQQQVVNRRIDADIEEAFWLVYGLEQKQSVLETVRSMLLSIGDDVRNAVEAGLAIANDQLQVEIRQNDVASKMLNVESGLRLAKWALCQSMGIQMTDSFDILAPEHFMAVMPSQRVEAEAVIERPELQLLQLNLQAEQLRKRIAIGEALPSLIVGAGYSYNNLLNKNAHNGTVFFTAKVPLTAWWETSSKIRQHDLLIRKAANQQSDYFEKMELETRRAWNELNEAYRQLGIIGRTVDNAKENLRISQLNYNAGLITLSEYLQSQSLYAQTLDQQSDARTRFLICEHKYQRLTEKSY